MLTAIESDPALDGPLPSLVALITPALARQWNVTVIEAPLITDPAGVPLLELSSEARLAMVVTEVAPGGKAVVTEVATGPAPAEAQTVFAVAC
jgi:hypothetical protein